MAGIGRKRGSRNVRKPRTDKPRTDKPRTDIRTDIPTISKEPEADTGSTLQYHQLCARRVEDRIAALQDDAAATPRDFALLDASLARHLRAIAELKGETKITEARIVKSEAWAVFWARLGAVLDRFPEALDAVHAEVLGGSGKND